MHTPYEHSDTGNGQWPEHSEELGSTSTDGGRPPQLDLQRGRSRDGKCTSSRDTAEDGNSDNSSITMVDSEYDDNSDFSDSDDGDDVPDTPEWHPEDLSSTVPSVELSESMIVWPSTSPDESIIIAGNEDDTVVSSLFSMEFDQNYMFDMQETTIMPSFPTFINMPLLLNDTTTNMPQLKCKHVHHHACYCT